MSPEVADSSKKGCCFEDPRLDGVGPQLCPLKECEQVVEEV